MAENVLIFDNHRADASCVPEVDIRTSGVSVYLPIHNHEQDILTRKYRCFGPG